MQQYLINQLYFRSVEQQILELLAAQPATVPNMISHIHLFDVSLQQLLSKMQAEGAIEMSKSYVYSITEAGRAALNHMQRQAA